MIAWETFEADGLCGTCGEAHGSWGCQRCRAIHLRTSDATAEWVLSVVRRQIEIAEALRKEMRRRTKR